MDKLIQWALGYMTKNHLKSIVRYGLVAAATYLATGGFPDAISVDDKILTIDLDKLADGIAILIYTLVAMWSAAKNKVNAQFYGSK